MGESRWSVGQGVCDGMLNGVGVAWSRLATKHTDITNDGNAEHNPGQDDKDLHHDELALGKDKLVVVLSMLRPDLLGDETHGDGIDDKDGEDHDVYNDAPRVVRPGDEGLSISGTHKDSCDSDSQEEPVDDGKGLEVLKQLLGHVPPVLLFMLVLTVKHRFGHKADGNIDNHGEGENNKGQEGLLGFHFISSLGKYINVTLSRHLISSFNPPKNIHEKKTRVSDGFDSLLDGEGHPRGINSSRDVVADSSSTRSRWERLHPRPRGKQRNGTTGY